MNVASEPGLLRVPVELDFVASLERFRHHGDDLMDRWDGQSFRRPFRLDGVVGAVSLRAQGTGQLRLEMQSASGPIPKRLRPRLEAMFVDGRSALVSLAGRDPVIAALLQLHPGIFPVRYLDPVGALLAIVTAQQVNLRLALTVRRAILTSLGGRIELGDDFVLYPDPERMAAASAEVWAGLHLTRAKGRCLSSLGAALVSGELSLEALEQAPDTEVSARLMELPGLGPWTCGQYLTRVLGRPLVVAEDLGVRKAVQLAYGLATLPVAEAVRELTADYREAAFSAQQLLLYHLSSQGRPASILA
ncbi:MAG: DNA-3-methyladenine glycosylase family protein [Candidatus Dormibacteria bacterium]